LQYYCNNRNNNNREGGIMGYLYFIQSLLIIYMKHNNKFKKLVLFKKHIMLQNYIFLKNKVLGRATI
jgi:hypothetical protein